MEYSIKYSKRKTIGLYVLRDGTVELRCPKGTNRRDADEFVRSKSDWIRKNVAAQKKRCAEKYDFAIGSVIPYLGKEYRLTASKDMTYGFDGKRFFMPEGYAFDDTLRKLYVEWAQDVMKARVAKYAKIMGVSPKSVGITSAKTRWGSCSAANSLNFSWRLVMAPLEAVDYVAVHELAHIRHKNHGADFWKEVEKYLPDYRDRIRELRKTERRL